MEADAIVKGDPAAIRFRNGKGIDMTANPRCSLTYDEVSGQVSCVMLCQVVSCCVYTLYIS